MKFLSAAQEKAYHSALKRRYKAVAFDIDGTLTELSRWTIPETLCTMLNALPPDVPLAFCTGRPMDYIRTKLTHICASAADPEAARKRWYVLAENGGVGYAYKPRKKNYDRFLEILWPNSTASL